ncbi:MAG: hypothetical protein ACLSEY_16195 [Enterocloster sp.]
MEEYVDNAYIRRQEGKFVPGTGPVFLKIVTEGLNRTFYVNQEKFCTFEGVTSICSEGLKKRKTLYRRDDRSVQQWNESYMLETAP